MKISSTFKRILFILLFIGILAFIVEFTYNTPNPIKEEGVYYPAHLDCGY